MVCGLQISRMAFELCQRAGLSDMIRAACPGRDPLIAMKPNLLGPIPASEGATTHPQIVEGVITYLREEGFRRLVVMESSWVGDKTSDSLLVTGFGELCSRLDVPFVDLQKDSSVRADCAGMQLDICRKALEADYLINLPVMKGHCQTRMTCALKNMKGCIPASEKRRFHRMGLHEPIGHLSLGIHQDFILADAICPDLTFEDGGNPVELNYLLCARDPVLMDSFARKMIGLPDDSVEYISIAERCGVGQSDLSRADITAVFEKHELGLVHYVEGSVPSGFVSEDGDYRNVLKLKELVSDVDSCSACYGTLIPVLRRLEAEGILKNIPEKICIGQGYRGKSGEIGIGNCTGAFRQSLPGCPPTAEQMEGFLRSLISLVCDGRDA